MRMQRGACLALTLAAFCLLAVGTAAEAQSTLFTDRGAWEASVLGLTNIAFEENAPGEYTHYGSGPAVFSGVTFTSPGNQIFTVDPDYDPGYEMGSGDVLSAQQGATQILVAALSGSFTAIGVDLRTFAPDDQDVTITLSTGEVFVVPTVAPSSFAGFLSTVGITSITFSSNASTDGALNIDNFAYGHVIPELPAPALAALPLGLLLRRRKK